MAVVLVVDTIPTSANKEDHVSISTGAALEARHSRCGTRGAALEARRALELARHVLAVEVLCACQAIEEAAGLAVK